MKTLKEYLVKEGKTIDKILAEKVANEIIRLANAGSYSFWCELTEEDLTGSFEGMSTIEFENSLPDYIASYLEGESIPVDPDDFTSMIEDGFCGDAGGETDMGYNAHDEILEYVKGAFKKYKI